MLVAACFLSLHERPSQPYSSVCCGVSTFPDFPFLAWLFLPEPQDNVQESSEKELIVFGLISEFKMSME